VQCVRSFYFSFHSGFINSLRSSAPSNAFHVLDTLCDFKSFRVAIANRTCPLYGQRRFVIQCSTVQRTLLAIIFAVLLSLMFAPHSGRGVLRFSGYAHGPFFIMPSQVDRKRLVLQTIIISVAAVVIVNVLPRPGRK
jgi:hypothetical protein